MTGPHPDATGSYGAEFERIARRRGRSLRWWQRLAAARILEHDRRGRLVWREWLLTLSRQMGKSWLLCDLALYRMGMAERIGEPQLVMHLANKLSAAVEVQRPAQAWASQQEGWRVRRGAQETFIEDPDGDRWKVFSQGNPYGTTSTLAMVDEAWDILVTTVEDAVEPTLLAGTETQLGLISTANPQTTSTFPDRRAAALAGSGSLLIEWSAPPWVDLADEEGWRSASPHWTPARRNKVAAALQRAMAPRSTRPGEVDPLDSFRTQYLNIWPIRSADDMLGLPGERLLGEGVWESLVGDDEFVESAVFAVDDVAGGRGVAVAAAARTAGDRVAVEAYEWPDRRAAYEWIAEHAGAESVLLVGPVLQHDLPVTELGRRMPLEVRRFEESRAALAALRQMASRQAIVHGGRTELAGQVEACRVVVGASGLRVVSDGRWELVRVASWAAAAVERMRRSSPTVH